MKYIVEATVAPCCTRPSRGKGDEEKVEAVLA